MKKICIAIDTSPSAEKVAKLGYEYAQALNAEVVLLHVIYDVEMYQYDYDPIMGYEGFFIQQDIKLVANKDTTPSSQTRCCLSHPTYTLSIY